MSLHCPPLPRVLQFSMGSKHTRKHKENRSGAKEGRPLGVKSLQAIIQCGGHAYRPQLATTTDETKSGKLKKTFTNTSTQSLLSAVSTDPSDQPSPLEILQEETTPSSSPSLLEHQPTGREPSSPGPSNSGTPSRLIQ